MENYSLDKTSKFKVLIALMLTVSLSLGVYVYRAKTVEVQIDDQLMELKTYADTVENFLTKEEIVLEEGAYINHKLEMPIEDNMQIIIKNPKGYTISVGDNSFSVTSVHDKVADIISDLDIKIDHDDYTVPSMDSKVAKDATIEIYQYTEDTKVWELDIDFPVIEKKNKDLPKGTTKVIQKGVKGKRTKEVKMIYLNSKLVEETVLKDEVFLEPIEQIVEKGTKEVLAAPTRSGNLKAGIVMNATAYDLSYASTGKRPGDKYYGITASGTHVKPGTVAVDPKVIPLGTKLYIESMDSWPDYGYAVAEDKGSAIKGNKIDLFMESRSQCMQFGRRKVKVYILD